MGSPTRTEYATVVLDVGESELKEEIKARAPKLEVLPAPWALAGTILDVMPRLLEIEELPLRLDRHGQWRHGSEPLHPRVAELFARHVVPRPDGTYVVRLERDEQPVEVELVAYFVRRVELEESGAALRAVTLHLSDGGLEPLRPETLMLGDDDALYCRLERGGLSVAARFLSTPHHALAAHAEVDGDGAWLRLAGRRWPFGPLDAGTRPL